MGTKALVFSDLPLGERVRLVQLARRLSQLGVANRATAPEPSGVVIRVVDVSAVERDYRVASHRRAAILAVFDLRFDV